MTATAMPLATLCFARRPSEFARCCRPRRCWRGSAAMNFRSSRPRRQARPRRLSDWWKASSLPSPSQSALKAQSWKPRSRPVSRLANPAAAMMSRSCYTALTWRCTTPNAAAGTAWPGSNRVWRANSNCALQSRPEFATASLRANSFRIMKSKSISKPVRSLASKCWRGGIPPSWARSAPIPLSRWPKIWA